MSRPSRPLLGHVVVEGSLAVGSASRRPGKEAWRVLCGSTPENTVSSGAIRHESRSSTRVSMALPPRVAVVCVLPSSGPNPRDGAAVSPVALFLSLIPFHSPMRRTPSRPTSLPPIRYWRFRVPSFYSVKLFAINYAGARLHPLYVFDAIMPRPLWRLVNST